MPNKGHCAVLVYGKHSTDRQQIFYTKYGALFETMYAHLYTVLKINTIWEYASLFFFFFLPFSFHTLDFVTCQSQINLI